MDSKSSKESTLLDQFINNNLRLKTLTLRFTKIGVDYKPFGLITA